MEGSTEPVSLMMKGAEEGRGAKDSDKEKNLFVFLFLEGISQSQTFR